VLKLSALNNPLGKYDCKIKT